MESLKRLRVTRGKTPASWLQALASCTSFLRLWQSTHGVKLKD